MDGLHPDARRLEELATLCVDGDATAVELDLSEWVRQPDCPAPARVLLATLLARRGEWRQARETLGEVLLAEIHLHDPRLVQMLVGLLLAQGLEDSAQRLAVGLRHMRADDPRAAEWAQLMALDIPDQVAEPVEGDAATLAAQLRQQPGVIPSLVFAQKIEPHQREIALLRDALSRAEGDMEKIEHHAMACLALAELAELADDPADARRWAERGLVLEPYSASLAMVLHRSSDDPAAAAQATQTLDRVVARFPTYPDVRAALIRREFADGKKTAAQQRLREWLDREPESAVARQVQQELAA